ncbi:hypothetical protein KUH03_30360 [Sphingobacterium sp. E70]|uniref:hypothetical protein n=1 Tax=Sphingobacterium sp. E70 TaxID=2853439 RepID=UPI00211C3B96|nr:hypothetical protein [Sphingobacterium sp. E70]ULT23458.1 hypothetical protein KUH03_30360 [Sphingobacterium sp. E70]
MDKDDFLRLFAKKLADGLTASEQLDYDLYLVEHKQDKEISLLLEEFYKNPRHNESTNKNKLDAIWKKLMQRKVLQQKPIITVKWSFVLEA